MRGRKNERKFLRGERVPRADQTLQSGIELSSKKRKNSLELIEISSKKRKNSLELIDRASLV